MQTRLGSQLIARVLRWCATLALFCAIPTRASAEELTLKFDTFDEQPLARLCIVADFVTFSAPLLQPKDDSNLIEKDGNLELSASSSSSGVCTAIRTPSWEREASDREYVPAYAWCVSNRSMPATDEKRFAVIRIANAVVTDSELTQDVARLQLNPGHEQQGKPAHVEVLGGSYFERSAVSFRMTRGAQQVEIPLVPRCVERTLELPAHACNAVPPKQPLSKDPAERPRAGARAASALSNGEKPPKLVKGGRRKAVAGSSMRVDVHNPGNGIGELAVEHCGHRFTAQWQAPVPPHGLRLEARSFWFSWRQSCLAPPAVCPTPQVQGISVACDPTTPLNGVCHYECKGAVRFPAPARFSFSERSVTSSWDETLEFPGQTLADYIPPDQRRVRLKWALNDTERQSRARWAADEITHVQIRTPEGTLHRVHLQATQLRVPELDCGDWLEYQYVGARRFKETPVAVSKQGDITLADPSKTRADGFSIGFDAGGGLRWLSNADTASWAPHLGFEAILVFKQLRDVLRTVNAAIDIELRGGVIFANQPHCSKVRGSFGNDDCIEATWERLPYWHIPVTLGYNVLYSRPDITHGAAFGVAWSTYHSPRDHDRLRRPVMPTARLHLGYRLADAWSAETFIRAFFNEAVVETVFDDAGLVSQGERNDSNVSLYMGAVLRLDEVF
jgi:hypothetical protein